MAEFKNVRIGDILLERGIINSDQLTECLQIQQTDDRKIGEILVDKGFVTDEEISQVLAEIYEIPYVNLTEIKIPNTVYEILPIEILRKYKVLPLELDNQILKIATNNPLDVTAMQEIQYLSGFQIDPVIACAKDLNIHLESFIETMHTLQGSGKNPDVVGASEIPIIKLVDSIISKAIKERASDIHFEPQPKQMRVRFRIDGILYERNPIAHNLQRKVISRMKILAGMDVADNRRPQDGRFTPLQYTNFDVRCSTLPDVHGENMVLRLLDKTQITFTFENLGMDEQETQMIQQLIRQPHGMILLTGPTGAGKSTTLYTMLSALNDISRNIITVEDPVEYRLEGITQTAINTRAGYSFATAIRHILRHDPDIIMVGEIRDQETAEIAIRSALTGHLVLSTLHTNTAAGAVMRLIEMGVEPFLVRSSVIGVLAQRLVRRLCPHCKKDVLISPEEIQTISKYVPVDTTTTLAVAGKCAKCFNTGYMGRVAIYESLIVTNKIRQAILNDPNEEQITQIAVDRGMKTLKMAGFKKAVDKVTSLEEVLRVTFTEDI
ncbi:MAG: Flp pilus assembly complex ATPase component TadA [Candidatus Omnitrophica bacterium]|nr:Flp pilus assembly complex ATPase component TadA [Candidatus Omnitrophota bacterium]